MPDIDMFASHLNKQYDFFLSHGDQVRMHLLLMDFLWIGQNMPLFVPLFLSA